MKHRFLKSMRLSGTGVFLKLLRSGARCFSEHVGLFAHIAQHQNRRLGVVVPKKHVKSAVLRHRLKRVAREWFRQQNRLPLNFDYLIFFKKSIAHWEPKTFDAAFLTGLATRLQPRIQSA